MFVQVNNLTFKYANADEDTVKGVSFDLEKGKIASLLGPSGCGKSTLLRLISGLEEPKRGSIVINNETVVDERTYIPPEKRNVGMVFQDYALFPHMTVGQNIVFGLDGGGRKDRQRRLKEVLSLVHLEGYERRYPYELSGGQQQRVAIARALAPEPNLLLLDEPFSNLDTELKEKIRMDLLSIIKSVGITSILVTHDIEDAKALADKVITLNAGQVV
ncbi:ABC transporter ATP-binding protein [Vallitalea okinawensis]|uniref:ABC transporter ATP-binding protein n=1 Tax=Vallitalea okinawensis TaxID=2078660 RepID=UPI000CFD5BD7|nr:ABC transporter ATP-binding protein [Vallitalea okinawensis]